MHKEHKHFMKSYASHLNSSSKDKGNQSERSNGSGSVNKEGEGPNSHSNIIVKGQDLPTDVIS